MIICSEDEIFTDIITPFDNTLGPFCESVINTDTREVWDVRAGENGSLNGL